MRVEPTNDECVYDIYFDTDEEFNNFKKSTLAWSGKKRFSWKQGEAFIIDALTRFVKDAQAKEIKKD